MVIRNDLKGIRGWLILLALNVMVLPVAFGLQITGTLLPLLMDGTFAYLANPNSEGYFPEAAMVIIAEISIIAALVLGSLYVCYLFFAHHYKFPIYFIAFLLAAIALLIGDCYLAHWAFPEDPLYDNETQAQLIKSFISLPTYMIYLSVSKRVKATFVEGRPS
ncbi:DUF2569 family protein [Neptunomonas marina]|uniref:DUF2569 family protein n=1 Tax=Neptunomonas marina TaxID=1815562 RepID=A0A437QES6_9GAMM|nr:DUF2569 family protein [Neptunomonas marina]RVU32899.1 DUF2569 family protein [Neptunomonas marina]